MAGREFEMLVELAGQPEVKVKYGGITGLVRGIYTFSQVANKGDKITIEMTKCDRGHGAVGEGTSLLDPTKCLEDCL